MKILRVAAVAAGAVFLGAPYAGAASFDLTTAGSNATINGALFTTAFVQSTGTGVINSFVRIQENRAEQGYNTDAAAFQFDEKAGLFTRSLLLSEVPLVTIAGQVYREFLLDINENNGGDNELLSLNEVQIYLRNGAALNGFTAGGCNTAASCAGTGFNSGTKVYGMDTANTDNTVELNYDLNSGSGSGDMFLYVLDSLFDGAPGEKYVYLYSAFGRPNQSDAGFEEWAVKKGTVPVPCTYNCDPGDTIPEPATISLLGLGLLGAGLARRRK